MSPDVLVLSDDSDYASEADSDFTPEGAPHVASDESSASESEREVGDGEHVKKPKSKNGKRKRAGGSKEEAEDVGFENSGDEEILERGLKKQKKKGKKAAEDEDDKAEGGLVKTRRMAALVTEEKKPLATTAAATVDVDALWASMTSSTKKANHYLVAEGAGAGETIDAPKSPQTGPEMQQGPHLGPKRDPPEAHAATGPEDNMIMIRRTYNFAGKVHVEEKLVSRDSAEAKLYLQSQSSGKDSLKPHDPNITRPLRPPKKARRSIFEPMTEPLPQRSDLRFGMNSVNRIGAGIRPGTGATAKKLNTVEKSKMDWAGFVDKEGIKDELETAGKAKGAYLDQREFLARVEEKRDEEARRARLKAL